MAIISRYPEGTGKITLEVRLSTPEDLEKILRFLRLPEYPHPVLLSLIRDGKSAVAMLDADVVGHHSGGAERTEGSPNIGLNQIDVLRVMLKSTHTTDELRRELREIVDG